MRDPEAAYEYAKKIRDPAMQTWFKRGVYFRWAERDPQRVMRLLDEGMGREEQGLLINSALPGLARNDPQAAFGYTARIEDAAARDAAQRMVFETWASDDPAAAADAVAATTDRELRSRLAAQVALYVVRERGERALEWAAEMDGGEGAAWTKTLETLAQQDARRAFEIAAATTTNGRARAVSAVIGSIATRDPEAAALYWQQLPANDDAGQEAAQQIAAHWVQRDSPAAERWVLGLLPGPTRDAALFGLLTGDTGDADPLRAAELINAIQNEGRRASMASMQIRRSLDAGDRNGAETLLQQVATDFPTREAFRRQIDEFQRENR
jgi:hypothetical protein